MESAVIGADSLTLDDISRACWKGFEEGVISEADAAAISASITTLSFPAQSRLASNRLAANQLAANRLAANTAPGDGAVQDIIAVKLSDGSTFNR